MKTLRTHAFHPLLTSSGWLTFMFTLVASWAQMASPASESWPPLPWQEIGWEAKSVPETPRQTC